MVLRDPLPPAPRLDVTGHPTQRNDIATLKSLMVSGALPVKLLRHISEIRHEPGCPQWITARNLQCWCEPVVYVSGVEVKA